MDIGLGACDRAYDKFIATIRVQMRFHSARFPNVDKAIADLLCAASEVDSVLELSRAGQIKSDLALYINLIQPYIDEYESDFRDEVVPDKTGILMRPSIGNIAINLGLYFQFYRHERYEAATTLLSELTTEWTVLYEWLQQKRKKTKQTSKGGRVKADNSRNKNKDVYEEIEREFATGKYVKSGKDGKSLQDLAKTMYSRKVNKDTETGNHKMAESTIYTFALKLSKNL